MLNSCLIALLGFTLSIGADFDLYFHRMACNCGRYIGTPFRSIRFTPNDSPASLFRHSCRIDSFGLTAMEADIILAEPRATVGFAGARVIEQTTRKSLPKGFQKAEFVMEHGFIDSIVPRSNQKKLLTELLKIHNGGMSV